MCRNCGHIVVEQKPLRYVQYVIRASNMKRITKRRRLLPANDPIQPWFVGSASVKSGLFTEDLSVQCVSLTWKRISVNITAMQIKIMRRGEG